MYLIGHAFFAFKYITFRLRLRNNELKYLFEPRVNFMRKCESAARYDAIHVRGWSSIICGALTIPLKLVVIVMVVGV